jgi:MoaA/NifB/PqqE/SkfB family radical SAM enzyme
MGLIGKTQRGGKLLTPVDEAGRLDLPPETAVRYGLVPGAPVEIEEEAGSLRIRRPVTHLAKLYIEPTARCNLNCRTCIRNVWDEATGNMTDDTFSAILAGLRSFTPPPTIFFGGFGEPLSHLRIVEMVAAVKALGCTVELITNGVLLSEKMSRSLIEAEIDRLWVSLDGARPESYADVRLGAVLPDVLANIGRFSASRPHKRPRRPELGIAFVAMRRNIADLPQVLNLGGRLGATRFLVTNVLPYTEEMRGEILYGRALSDVTYVASPWTPHVDLPKMDMDDQIAHVLYQVMRSPRNISFAGHNLDEANNRCPFIEAGSAAIGWDGRLSPCLPLLHDHTSYLNDRERQTPSYAVGRLSERSLQELWHSPEHITFRQRVRAFDFSPCTFCGGCDYSLGNEEDCYGNALPTCGGCLWAQGVIRCP